MKSPPLLPALFQTLTLLLPCAALVFGPSSRAADPKAIRVLIWDEQQPEQKQAYGERFLGETIAAYLEKQPGFVVKSVNFDSPEQGLDETTLATSDVIIWCRNPRASSPRPLKKIVAEPQFIDFLA